MDLVEEVPGRGDAGAGDQHARRAELADRLPDRRLERLAFGDVDRLAGDTLRWMAALLLDRHARRRQALYIPRQDGDVHAAAASSLAMARPMPLDPPVTMACAPAAIAPSFTATFGTPGSSWNGSAVEVRQPPLP